MKLKYIFSLFIATAALLSSCADEQQTATLLGEIKVSSSYVSLPVDGGSTVITVTAADSWTVEKVMTVKDSVEWLTISSATGSAGESELTFSAESTLDGRTAEVLINCAGKTQRINIIQGLAIISEATAAEVNAGPDGKTFRVTGVCTSIENTTYGNWYLKDETGSVYIYGTLDAKGATKNFLSLGLEVGDEITIEGPKSSYKGAPQMVDVMVIKINKSLIKVDSVKNAVLPLEGGEFTAYLTCKGQGVSVDIPEDAKSWLSISSIQSAGTNTVVKFQAAENAGEGRSTTITFNTTDGTKNYSVQATLTQNGAVFDISMAELIAIGAGGTIPVGAKLVAVLTSDPEGGNSTSKKNLIFTALDNKSGITARLTADNTTLVMGDKVEIDLTGATLSLYSGQLQLGVANDKVTKIGSATIIPRVATIAEIAADIASYNFCVVTTEGVLSGDVATWLNGEAHTTNKLNDGGVHLDVFLAKYITWGTQNMPTVRVKVTGIAQKALVSGADVNQLIIRNLSDVVEINN